MVIQQRIKLFKAPNTIITVKKEMYNLTALTTQNWTFVTLIITTTTFFFVSIDDHLVVVQIKTEVIKKERKKYWIIMTTRFSKMAQCLRSKENNQGHLMTTLTDGNIH